MMISAQTIGMSASRIPQPGIRIPSSVSLSPLRRPGGLKWSSGFQMGLGDSTLAITQASSFSSSAQDASDDEVPAKDTGVHDFTGIKTVELMDPISRAQLASTVDDQLPPLLSMVIDGLLPLQQSKYVHEAEKRLQQYAEHYPNATSLYSFCRAGLSTASYVHSGVISLDRLVAISINYGLLYVVDDLFFDNPDEFVQDQYGISHIASGNPQKFKNIWTT